MRSIVLAGGGTGGHLMPALALAEAIRSLQDEIDPVLVGADRGVERQILPERKFRYYLLPALPIYRRAWWRNVKWVRGGPRLVRAASAVVRDQQPVAVVSTGGYAAGPVAWSASRQGIPTVIQEQNAFPGLTTRWLARRAHQVHLGFPEARLFLRTRKDALVFDSGNPIVPLPAPRPSKVEARRGLGISDSGPVVFVFGGSQGARGINRVIADALDGGALDNVTLLWSTGRVGWDAYGSYHRPPLRIVKPFWDPVAEAYAAADLVVGRAGAMTTAEVCAWALPAIYVPLPHAAADHQTTNARALESAGAAILVPERDLTARDLADRLKRLADDPKRRAQMAAAAEARARPDAAKEIAKRILALVSKGANLS